MQFEKRIFRLSICIGLALALGLCPGSCPQIKSTSLTKAKLLVVLPDACTTPDERVSIHEFGKE